MSTAKPFIRVETRDKNKSDIRYAAYCTPEWVNNRKTNNEVWLGRIIDQDNGIFYNRKNGYYKFTIEDQFADLTEQEISYYQQIDTTPTKKLAREHKISAGEARQVIDFGHSFVINEFIKQNNIMSLFNFSCPRERDSLLSIIIYRIINSGGYLYAKDWWDTDYCHYIYNYAKLQSQRISEILINIGSETFFRSFFLNYITFLNNMSDTKAIVIDSTGLPNDIKCPLTAINNHNGIISNEIRLITAMDKITGLPIFYRYVPGNIVDVSTLKSFLTELEEYNVNIDRLVLDVGYFSKENITELIALDINFMTRMPQNIELFSLLVKKYAPNIQNLSNIVKYRSRTLFIKQAQIDAFGSKDKLFAYICFDDEKYNKDNYNYMKKLDIEKVTEEQFIIDRLSNGIFIILSSIKLPNEQILPCYYSRQSVEQFFDSIKNDSDLLPLRSHSEKTFSGHVMISFIATIIFLLIDKQLKSKKLSFKSGIYYLRSLHADVYKSKIIPKIPTKHVNDILKALKIKLPTSIMIKDT